MCSFDFIDLFTKKLNAQSANWYVKALIDSNNNLITLGTDSKLIGRIFELKSMPILQEIADENPGYILQKPESQTVYPDYLYVCPNGGKIAVDIKTCYRDPSKGKNNISYTLGAYSSFLRNGTKNIVGSYDEYVRHYIVGFVYDRLSNEDGIIIPYSPENLMKIPAPYGNVKVWVQEKFKVAGWKEGSGNTANIGSIISSDLKDFENGNGPFSVLGIEVFEDYWKNYKKNSKYNNIESYFLWARNNSELQNIVNFTALEKKYIDWRKQNHPTKEDYLSMAKRVLLFTGARGAKKKLLVELQNKSPITITSKKEIIDWLSACEKHNFLYENEKWD